MAREPSLFAPGEVKHAIQRGNTRAPIAAADEDYRFDLDCLKKTAKAHCLFVHAYVLLCVPVRAPVQFI